MNGIAKYRFFVLYCVGYSLQLKVRGISEGGLMKLDENEFYRQGASRICSSLNIEKALLNCMEYLQVLVPASEMTLSIFEPDLGILRNLASVTRTGIKKPYPPIPLTKEAIHEIESTEKRWQEVRIFNELEDHPVASLLSRYFNLSIVSALAMTLNVEGHRLGSLGLIADGKGRFTKAHADLISLLREPFSIAMSNALRYEELAKLKDIVDAENRELNRELRQSSGDTIIGADYGLKDVLEMVRQVAPLNSPVMLLGETGVGKEVIANVIHYTSSRREAPLIKVNCGAIPDNLVDSELFGHERGAFTGAITQRRGRFERADKGSIFLDEVGELPPAAQIRLLRVLQSKEIERVGGAKTIPVNVRIIAATHRSMEEMVRNGAFREDLWFRMNVFPIMIPPLRYRREDIPALVHHFLEKKSRELKCYPRPTVSRSGMERLKAYHWPGNVRELENLIERELIRNRGEGKTGVLAFTGFDLPKKGTTSGFLAETQEDFVTLDEAMSQYVRHALRRTKGKIYGTGGAAELLGLNPNTLRSRMRKLGIPFGTGSK